MGELLVVGSCNGMIRALDKRSGQVKWQYDIRQDGDQRQFHGDPLIAGDLLIIGTDGNSGHVYAFDKTTGAVRWKYAVKDRGVASDILRLGGNVYAVTLGSELVCLDLQSGKVKWTFRSSYTRENSHWSWSPAAAGDRVYFGGLDGIVYALDAESGKPIWHRDLGARVTTSVVVHDGDLYAGTAKRHLYRLNTASGELLGDFAAKSEPEAHIVVADNSLLVFLEEDALVSLDLSLEKVRWRAESPKDWTSARPYLWHGFVLAGDRGHLVAIRAADGVREWSHDIPGMVRGIGISDDVLYVGTLKGPVFAFAP